MCCRQQIHVGNMFDPPPPPAAATHRTDNHGHISNLATNQTNNGPLNFINNFYGHPPPSYGSYADANAAYLASQNPTTFDLPFELPHAFLRSRFVGREDEFARIHEAFQSPGRVQVVVRGLGGIGKTQLASEYARRYHDDYSAVLWVDAKDDAAVARSYAAVRQRVARMYQGLQLGDEMDAVDGVKGWLNRKGNERWLMIVDNVDRVKVGGKDGVDLGAVLPAGAQGKVLVTTRSKTILGHARIDLGRLGDAREGLELLMHASGRGEEVMSDPDARLLVEDLDGLPLALATAGTYLTQEAVTFAEYRQFYQSSWETLDAVTSDLLTSEEKTVGGTCDITLQQLRSESLACVNMLAFWGLLESDDIWYELLKPGASDDLPWLALVTRDKLTFNQIMHLLCERGLAETSSTQPLAGVSKGYSMHSCVHAWIKAILVQELSPSSARVALQLVSDQICHETASYFWVRDRRIMPHANRIWDVAQGMGIEIDPRIMFKLGQLQQRNSHFAKAAVMYEQAIKSFAANEQEDKKALNAFRSLATVLIEQDQPGRATDILEALRRRLEERFGQHNRSTLHTLQALGWAYAESGRVDLARALLRHTVDTYEEEYGKKHLYTLGALNNLANLLQMGGDFEQAEKIFTKVLQVKQETLGPKDPRTIGTLHNLGKLYRAQGYLDDAERIYKREHEEFLEIYGKRNFKTIMVEAYIGLVYRKQARYEEAETILRKALNTAHGMRGLYPRAMHFILNELGFVLADQGKLVECQKYFQAAQIHASNSGMVTTPDIGSSISIDEDEDFEKNVALDAVELHRFIPEAPIQAIQPMQQAYWAPSPQPADENTSQPVLGKDHTTNNSEHVQTSWWSKALPWPASTLPQGSHWDPTPADSSSSQQVGSESIRPSPAIKMLHQPLQQSSLWEAPPPEQVSLANLPRLSPPADPLQITIGEANLLGTTPSFSTQSCNRHQPQKRQRLQPNTDVKQSEKAH
ncbi:hypothetical protein KVT40_002278 [Elsinoe batatas]|uniref:Orc1-like AAA ATPase domain-containing protein n=1 Tax=Elsinoe batatas TaxID=2601811 RepID=A0A8K0PM49_9PEZI|nr:hypothetical protein KVT40_002278 [Elsinoe batatas]